MAPQYEDNRAELEQLFEERARMGGQISYQTYEEIKSSTKDFLAVLHQDIRDMN
ncbi:MAG: hypothetical protein GTO03_07635, partial [Planctomycetales bacterium]|nr:hypothetical protein [Planctomycetales bacterium]